MECQKCINSPVIQLFASSVALGGIISGVLVLLFRTGHFTAHLRGLQAFNLKEGTGLIVGGLALMAVTGSLAMTQRRQTPVVVEEAPPKKEEPAAPAKEKKWDLQEFVGKTEHISIIASKEDFLALYKAWGDKLLLDPYNERHAQIRSAGRDLILVLKSDGSFHRWNVGDGWPFPSASESAL